MKGTVCTSLQQSGDYIECDTVDSGYLEHHLIMTKCQEQNKNISFFFLIG